MRVVFGAVVNARHFVGLSHGELDDVKEELAHFGFNLGPLDSYVEFLKAI